MALNGLGLYLFTQHRADEAIEDYHAALKINSRYDDAYSNLGRALAEQGKYPEATAAFEASLRLRPGDIKTLNNYGNVLILQGRYSDAAAQFQEILRLQPDNFNAHNNLAVSLEKQGKTGPAITEYREAIRLQPGFLGALNNLALILATNGDARFRSGSEAMELATRACDLTRYQNPTLLATLAAAYAEMGRYPEALSLAQQAQAMAGNQATLAAKLAAMTKEFSEGHPYRGE